MKTRLILIFLNFSIVIYSQGIDSALFKAYKYNSKIILDEFFSNWERSFETNREEILSQNDTIIELYNIVESFYKNFANNQEAKDFSPLSDNIKYFILTDKLGYQITYVSELKGYDYKDTSAVRKDSVMNFRPFEKIGYTKLLYINDMYYNSFVSFFKVPYSYKYYDEEPFYKDMAVYNQKISFLSDYVKISHTGNFPSPELYFWKLLSEPKLEFIRIKKDLNQSFVYYNISCAFMEDQFIRINGKWTKIKETCLLIC